MDTDKLVDVLMGLNHHDDAHWTKAGRPKLNVLTEAMGQRVTRNDIAEAGYRQYAREEPVDPAVFTEEKIWRAAKACHEANRAYCESIGDGSQVAWEDAPNWQKVSAVSGVKFHINDPFASAAASHENWLYQKEADGWSYGPTKDVDAKTHPCMVPFEDLPLEQQHKDAIFRKSVWSSLKAGIIVPRPSMDGASDAEGPMTETEINQRNSETAFLG